MAFTSYTDAALLGHLLGPTTFAKPSTVYVALFNGDPLAGGTEISGGAYTRLSGTFTVSGNVATNSANIEYPAATAVWGNVDHVAIYDAATSGNQLVTAALTVTKTINLGDILRIPSSSLSVTLS